MPGYLTGWNQSQFTSASTVGDIIISARSLCPDPCGQLPPPGTGSFTLAQVAGGLPSGTYYVALTWANAWGETTSYEQSLTLSGPGGIQVTIPSIPANAEPNVYWGTVSQNETNQATNVTSPFVITETVSGYQTPPAQNNAWLPDTDGQLVNASSFYRWINEGLDELCRVTGGILDRAGVPTISGKGSYEIPSYWTKLTNVWYDGWPLMIDFRKNLFFYNAITGIPSIATMDTVGGKCVIQIWPQADRTANSTNLSAPLALTDSTVNVINSDNNPSTQNDQSQPNIGCFIISDPAQSRFPEWCYFQNQTPTSYTNVTRGVGGSQAIAWQAGTPVYEANFMFAGYRMATHYYPGNANLRLDCPPMWQNALTDYILYRFKLTTQQQAEAKDIYQSFQMKAREVAQQREITRRTLLPKFNSGPPGVYPLGPFGSVIIP